MAIQTGAQPLHSMLLFTTLKRTLRQIDTQPIIRPAMRTLAPNCHFFGPITEP